MRRAALALLMLLIGCVPVAPEPEGRIGKPAIHYGPVTGDR